MSDQMQDPQRFEARLADQLNRFAAAGVRPADPVEMAEEIVARPRPAFGMDVFGRRSSWRPVVAALLALLLLAAALTVSGTLPHLFPVRQLRLGLITGGELVLTDAAGSQQVLIDASVPGFLPEQTPVLKAVRFSPDGRLLAIVPGQEIGDTFWKGLAIITLGGNVLLDEGAAEFGWAPDSQHVLAADLEPSQDRPELTLLGPKPTASGVAKWSADRLALPQPGYPLAVGWRSSREGIVVAKGITFSGDGYSSEGGVVTAWSVDVSTGVVTRAGTLGDAAGVAVSPDGARIAYVAGATVHVLTLGGPECAVALDLTDAGKGDDWAPAVAWSADSDRLAISLTRGGRGGIWLVPASCATAPTAILSGTFTGSIAEDNAFDGPEGPALRVSEGEAVRGPLAWSPDGRWIYYRGLTAEQNAAPLPRFGLRRVPTDGGASELVAPRVEWFDLGLMP
jgi:WD40-like Beta Propeller Repeat